MEPAREPLAFFDRLVVPVLGVLAAVILFSLMILTCVDVVGRYFFSRPIYGAFEITEMLLAGLIFSGLPLVTLRNDHVTVDILDGVVSPALARIQHIVVCLISFVATGYLAWRLWVRAVGMVQSGETTAQLKFKLGYLTYGMSLLMALTALALLVLMFRQPRRGQGSEV